MRFNFISTESSAFAAVIFGLLWNFTRGGGISAYPFVQALSLVISIPFNLLFALPQSAPWLLLPVGVLLLFYLDFLGDRLAPILSFGIVAYLAIALGA